MSYKSKHGITSIRNPVATHWINDGVDISFDIDENRKKIAVILYTPDLNDKNDHLHIELSRKEAKVLKDWLDAYLKDTK